MLPHLKPKTTEQLQANIKHLKTASRHHAKMVDFHEHKAYFSKVMYEKVLPKFKKMGYNANNSQYMKEEKQSHKYHSKETALHKAGLAKTKTLIDNHKQLLKGLSVRPSKVTRNMVLHMPVTQVIANAYPIDKNGDYYQRLSKLYSLSIDGDAQKHIQDMGGNTAEKTKEYMKAYKDHPLYSKMAKYMRKAARQMDTENLTTTVTATVRSDNSNLLYEIYNDCATRLYNQGVLKTSPKFEEIMTAAIAKHPKINLIEHLKVEK